MINGIYATRHSRVWNELADPVFDVLNKEGVESLALIGGGCLDAPDQLPAGSVKRYSYAVLPKLISRPEPEDLGQAALAKRIIDEILKEQP